VLLIEINIALGTAETFALSYFFSELCGLFSLVGEKKLVRAEKRGEKMEGRERDYFHNDGAYWQANTNDIVISI
jgi:hypothetical protein